MIRCSWMPPGLPGILIAKQAIWGFVLAAAGIFAKLQLITNPEPSVIYSPAGTISQKKLENPAGFWNNVGENRSSLFQNKGAFE